MKTFRYKNKAYEVDDLGFLQDYEEWDKDFADGMALEVGISDGLSEEHWHVINYVRFPEKVFTIKKVPVQPVHTYSISQLSLFGC